MKAPLPILIALLTAGCATIQPKESDEARQSTLLAEHQTISRFNGLQFHTCRGMTALCPDQCGHSGTMASFDIIEYTHFQSFSEYGKPQKAYHVLIGSLENHPRIDPRIYDQIQTLSSGDRVVLWWAHNYITENGASFPERPITKLERISTQGIKP